MRHGTMVRFLGWRLAWLWSTLAVSHAVTMPPFVVQGGSNGGVYSHENGNADSHHRTSAFAAGMMYDDRTDRIYVTGSTLRYDGRIPFNASDPPRSDCFLGILQLPRSAVDAPSNASSAATSSAAPVWVRRRTIGVPDQAEACAAVHTIRHGNDRKLVVTGHSVGGTSVLHDVSLSNRSSSSSSSSSTLVYGLVLDLTWYGQVKGGLIQETLIHSGQGQAPPLVQYPVALASGGSGDVLVASIQSTVGATNPAHLLHVQEERTHAINASFNPAVDFDSTTAGGYWPPPLGDRYSMQVQRLGRRAQSINELLTVGTTTTSQASTRYATYQSNSPLLNATLTQSTLNGTITHTMSNGTVNDTIPPEVYYEDYSYLEEPLVERWRREFATEEHASVQVSSLLSTTLYSGTDTTATPVVIVAGSTRGSLYNSHVDGSTTHGFVMALDATTGLLRRTRTIVTSRSGATVRVLGLCQLCIDESTMVATKSEPFLYLVGMTDGSFSSHQVDSTGASHAFLQKIHATNLTAIWTRELQAVTVLNATAYASGSIHGMACAVTPDGTEVYMAGTVLRGASIAPIDSATPFVVHGTHTSGRDDLFVAQFKTVDGSLNFVRQFGTEHDDRLATGDALVSDKHGNAILLGNTRGAYVPNVDSGSNDFVLISVDRITGEHVDIAMSRGRSTPSPAPVDVGPPSTTPTTISSQPDARPLSLYPSAPPAAFLTNPPIGIPAPSTSDTRTLDATVTIVSVALALVIVATLVWCGWRFNRRREQHGATRSTPSYDGPYDIALLSKIDGSDDYSAETVHYYMDDGDSCTSTGAVYTLPSSLDARIKRDPLLRFANV